eukprot:RCo027336
MPSRIPFRCNILDSLSRCPSAWVVRPVVEFTTLSLPYCLAYSSEAAGGRVLAFGEEGGSVSLTWGLPSTRGIVSSSDSPVTLARWEAHGNAVYDLSFSGNSDAELLSCSGDMSVKLWAVERVRQGPLRTFVHHTGSVKSLSTLPGSSVVASGGREGSVCLWDIRSSGAQPFAVLEAVHSPVSSYVPFALRGSVPTLSAQSILAGSSVISSRFLSRISTLEEDIDVVPSSSLPAIEGPCTLDGVVERLSASSPARRRVPPSST